MVPFLVLLVPILDMTLVSATRILTGRSVAEGGGITLPNRLVSLGLSDRSAVLLLWGLAAAAGFVALFINRAFSLTVTLWGIAGFGLLQRQNGNAPMKPVGFLDDSEQKRNQTVHGVTVLGGGEDIEEVHRKTKFQQLALSSNKISEENLRHIKAFCREKGIPIKRYFWTSEDVA